MYALFLHLRQSLRSLLRTPGFLVSAVACLALGIGANLAVASLLDRLVLRPLPFPNSAQLTVIQPADTTTGETGPITMADFLDLRSQCGSFQDMAACTSRVRTLTGQDEPVRVNVGMVTAHFFEVLGVEPALGRLVFRAEEEVEPAPVAVLRYDFWTTRFHGDPSVIGRSVILDGQAFQIVGVLPANFRFYNRITQSVVFTPEAVPFAGRNNRAMGTFLAIGRLRPGVYLREANNEAHVAATRIASSVGNPRFDAKVSSLLEFTTDGYRQVLLAFQGAVVLVLLITCFNVTGLQLVRDMSRRRDLAIRQALGAGLTQIGYLFLLENLIISLLGGTCGIALSYELQAGLAWMMKDLSSIPLQTDVYPALVGVALVLSLLTGLGLTFLSWFMVRRSRLVDYLGAGSRGSYGRAHWRILKGLVVGEVSLSVVLLLGAGLLIHSLINLQRVNPGFEAHGLLTVRVPLPPQKYSLGDQRAFLSQLESNLASIPGVKDVGCNDTMPFVKATNGDFVSATPRVGRAGQGTYVRWHVVTPNYFQTMGTPLVAGQTFGSSDPHACVISRRLAHMLWADQDPLGRLLYSGYQEPFVVQGVVANTAENVLDHQGDPQVYVPAGFYEMFEGPVVALRVQGDPGNYRTQVKSALRALDPELALPEPQPMTSAMKESLALPITVSKLFLAFGTLSLILAGVGLYSVLGQIALQRRREIGIRMSLGATRLQVAGDILSGASVLVGFGLVLGSLLGWGLNRALNQWLFGLNHPGFFIYMGLLMLLVPTALLACLVPALRAARVNPADALRME